MNHRLETHIHFPTANYFSHVRRIIGLENGDFDALFLEVALGLSKVKRSMVWRRLPSRFYFNFLVSKLSSNVIKRRKVLLCLNDIFLQFLEIRIKTLPVGEKSDLVRRHSDIDSIADLLLTKSFMKYVSIKNNQDGSSCKFLFLSLRENRARDVSSEKKKKKKEENIKGEHNPKSRMSFR